MPKKPRKKVLSDEIEFFDRWVPYWEMKEDLKDGYQLLPGKTIQRIAFEGTKEAITIREISIMNKNGSDCKTITQYHYENWPDHGAPKQKIVYVFIL